MDSKRGYLLDSFDRGFSMAAKAQLVHFLEQYFGQARSTKSGRSSTGVTTVSRALNVIIDGGGVQLATGVKCDIGIPFACTITGVRVFADQSGSAVVDIWKDSYANFPPTVADTITASAKPTLSSATKYSDTTLTGWTTAIAAGDILRFNVDSATSVTRLDVELDLQGN